jgi:hypothetical protein
LTCARIGHESLYIPSTNSNVRAFLALDEWRDYAVTAEMTVWILIERRSGGVSRWSHWPIDVRLFDRSMDAHEFSPRLTKAQSLSG